MSKYTSYILYLLISVFVVLLYINNFGPLETLQQSVTDLLIDVTKLDGTRPNVVLVNIDYRTQDEYGDWPWNRDLMADLLAATASGEPGAILADFEFSENAFQDSAGYTAVLAEQMSWIENIIIPYDIALTTYNTGKTNNPEHLFDYSLTVDNPLGIMDEKSSLQTRKVFLPAEKLLQSEPRLGFNYTMPDEDRILRHQPLVMNYEGYYYPSVSLLVASTWLGVLPEDITIIENKFITSLVVGSTRSRKLDYFRN